MMETVLGRSVTFERDQFDVLLSSLAAAGYKLIGPTVRDGAVVYDEIENSRNLPVGWTDEQGPGVYRLERSGDDALFGYTMSPQSWKRFLHPPVIRLWSAERENGGLKINQNEDTPSAFAFIGVRACELHAIQVQDRVFLEGKYVDPIYKARREKTFIIAVNCGRSGGTCYCVSMKTGPAAPEGFDLALTELIQPGRHYFVAQIGSLRGQEIIQHLNHTPATQQDLDHAETQIENAVKTQGRSMDTSDLKPLLYSNYEHPRWKEVASRCLTCTNCTMVCPTCFCTTVEDVTDLSGTKAERVRKWDSCFTMDFSYIHGGSVRSSTMSRYRQWMTHKLATWQDQFGEIGCIGCGRCITWCPVGIDITEEVRAIRESQAGSQAGKEELK